MIVNARHIFNFVLLLKHYRQGLTWSSTCRLVGKFTFNPARR